MQNGVRAKKGISSRIGISRSKKGEHKHRNDFELLTTPMVTLAYKIYLLPGRKKLFSNDGFGPIASTEHAKDLPKE